MNIGITDTGIKGLPAILPVFPLSGALLLPRGHLPLNIFEPRYLHMIDDALGLGRIFGMVQPAEPEGDPVNDHAALFPVGCAARIVSFEESTDGRYMIALRGLCRFRIGDEVPIENGYRRCHADYSAFGGDLAEDNSRIDDRGRLLIAVRRYLEMQSIEVDWGSLEDTADEALVTSLAMICPFEPREQQALLTSPDLQTRGKLLASLMEMALLEGDSGSGEGPGSTRH